jgi:hypothetical protein
MNTATTVRVIQTEAGAVLQNTDNGATFSTNLVGATICKYLTKGLTRNEIIHEVSIQFAATRDEVCRDLEEFVERLKQTGLLQQEMDKPR